MFNFYSPFISPKSDSSPGKAWATDPRVQYSAYSKLGIQSNRKRMQNQSNTEHATNGKSDYQIDNQLQQIQSQENVEMQAYSDTCLIGTSQGTTQTLQSQQKRSTQSSRRSLTGPSLVYCDSQQASHAISEISNANSNEEPLPDHPLKHYFPDNALDPQNLGNTNEEQIANAFIRSSRYNTLNFSANQVSPPMATWLLIDPQRLMEGCLVRGLISGVGGYVIGVMLGGFFHSMQPMDTSYGELNTREAIKLSYRGFGTACTRQARTFSRIGTIYAMTECIIEKERGTHEMANAVYAGCFTGGFLGMAGGAGSMVTGCLGFAAFSAVIEKFMGNYG